MKKILLFLSILFLSCGTLPEQKSAEKPIEIETGMNTDTLPEQGTWLDTTQSIGTKTAVQVIISN